VPTAAERGATPAVRAPQETRKPADRMGWLVAAAAAAVLLVGAGYGWYGSHRRNVANFVAAPAASRVMAAAPSDGSTVPNESAARSVSVVRAGGGAERAAGESADGAVLTVVVQPGQSISELCLRYLGQGDVKTLKAISDLNKLANPNHIEVGQRLLLPRRNLTVPPGTGQDSQSAGTRRVQQ
jgi:nucleoid-associated protein YgaU